MFTRPKVAAAAAARERIEALTVILAVWWGKYGPLLRIIGNRLLLRDLENGSSLARYKGVLHGKLFLYSEKSNAIVVASSPWREPACVFLKQTFVSRQ